MGSWGNWPSLRLSRNRSGTAQRLVATCGLDEARYPSLPKRRRPLGIRGHRLKFLVCVSAKPAVGPRVHRRGIEGHAVPEFPVGHAPLAHPPRYRSHRERPAPGVELRAQPGRHLGFGKGRGSLHSAASKALRAISLACFCSSFRAGRPDLTAIRITSGIETPSPLATVATRGSSSPRFTFTCSFRFALFTGDSVPSVTLT